MPVIASAQARATSSLSFRFPAGGVTDLVARTLSEGLSKDLGQAIVVLNQRWCRRYHWRDRDGAGGTGRIRRLVFSAMGVITGRAASAQ